jgi:hypothetical protein
MNYEFFLISFLWTKYNSLIALLDSLFSKNLTIKKSNNLKSKNDNNNNRRRKTGGKITAAQT